MKIDDWCDANGVTRHAYYYWLRKIRQAACLDIPTVNAAQNPTSFKRLEVQTRAAGTQAAVIIHLPAATLEVYNGASQQTVEAVLLALKFLC